MDCQDCGINWGSVIYLEWKRMKLCQPCLDQRVIELEEAGSTDPSIVSESDYDEQREDARADAYMDDPDWATRW